MNKIHRIQHKNYRLLFFLVLMLAGSLSGGEPVQAANLSIGVSASSVMIGDKVTVSITVPAGVTATVNLTYPSDLFTFSSASETSNANGGTVSMTLGGYGGTDTATTGTVVFKAKAAGTARFSVTAPMAGNEEGDQVTIGGASTSVKVKNEAVTDGNNSGQNTDNKTEPGDSKEKEKEKSKDNSLASLKLSAGTLSPAFQYNVVNYTAQVEHSVTSVVVSAKVSNAKATIVSVTGGEDLKVGDNWIQIVVKAENGVSATYSIKVTREAENTAAQTPEPAAGAEPEPAVDPAPAPQTPEDSVSAGTQLPPEGDEEPEDTLTEIDSEELPSEEEPEESGEPEASASNDGMEEEIAGLKKQNTLIIGAAAVIILILLVVIILLVLALHGKGRKEETEDEDLEFIDL